MQNKHSIKQDFNVFIKQENINQTKKGKRKKIKQLNGY